VVVAGPAFSAVLASRRMCRDFREDPLPAGVLDGVLDAAFRGPAAGNTDGLELLVLEGGRTADYWELTLPAPQREGFPWPGLLRAPVLVLPYVDPEAYLERYSRRDKAGSGLSSSTEDWPVPYWFVDGGAAVMAVLLAAEAEGLGALFFGQFSYEPALRDRFGVPSRLRALGTVAVGWPAPGGRRPSASAVAGRPSSYGRVHRDRFGGVDVSRQVSRR
jgi:nitroreductase